MAVITGVFPYDIAHLLGGAARVLVSDTATPPTIPANVKDVIDIISPYAPKTNWLDIGSTTDSTNYERDMDSEGYEIQQTSGIIFEEITEVERTLEVEMAEFNTQNLQILENAPAVTTIAAAAGHTAQKAVKFGSITSLQSRRIAFVAQRNRGSGEVTESVGALKRGRFVAFCLYNATLAADASEVSIEKGELGSIPVTFRAFPEAGQTAGQEFGTWIYEEAGVMA